MAVFIDAPLWPWHGRLWSHLISDQSIEELHDFARAAGLRYLSFGFDHYDVPDVLFTHVQDLGAEVIDARDIVRKLRHAGLRTARGKAAKRWAPMPGGVPALVADGLSPALVTLAERAVGTSPNEAEALYRPGETALVVSGADKPGAEALSALRVLAGPERLVIASAGPWGWAVEIVDPIRP